MAATTSQVIAGLVDIATTIRNARANAAKAKLLMTSIKNELNSLPTTFATVVDQVNSYTPTGAFETNAKDELAKLTSEFQALKTAATTAEAGLAGITEF